MDLQVKPLKQKDAGRGLAAIDGEAMDRLDLDSGDYVRVAGPDDETVLRVWPGYPEDEGRGVIRFDGRSRQDAGVGIDDRVTVERADVRPAAAVSVAPPSNLRIRGDLSGYLRDELGGRPIARCQTVSVSLSFGDTQSIPFEVVETDPSGTVVVTDSTAVDVVEGRSNVEPIDGESEAVEESEVVGESEAVGESVDEATDEADGATDEDDPDGATAGDEPGESRRHTPISGEISRGLSDWELVVRVTVSDLTLGVIALVLVVALLTGSAYYLGQNTTTSFPGWLQAFGTIVSILLTGLIVVYHYAGRAE